MKFIINNDEWKVELVDASNVMLIDRTGTSTLATTDPTQYKVFISNQLSLEQFYIVLAHEVAHCMIISEHLTDDIHRMVRPEYWFDAEEWLCNYLVDYGISILGIVNRLLK